MKKAAVALLVALSFTACKQPKPRARQTAEGAVSLQSSANAGDRRVAAQFVKGLHAVEDNTWRWSERQFTIALAPPAGSAQAGAVLKLELTVPPVIIEKLKTISLTASIDGAGLAPETFDKPGTYTYRRNVPAAQLAGGKVLVNFQLDKAMQAAPPDIRELGVIVLSAALQAN